MTVAERIEFQLLLAKLTPERRALVKTVVTAALNAAPARNDKGLTNANPSRVRGGTDGR